VISWFRNLLFACTCNLYRYTNLHLLRYTNLYRYTEGLYGTFMSHTDPNTAGDYAPWWD
jgi:hypothetical protein